MTRSEFNKLVGKRSAKVKVVRKPVLRMPSEYPWRSNALGKTKNSNEGVAGWRSNYYRPEVAR
jgi:hypothetical protein